MIPVAEVGAKIHLYGFRVYQDLSPILEPISPEGHH
jgi:hypothetical protein